MSCASATRAAHVECTCACAWLRESLHGPRGAGWANPGNSRMQITPALAGWPSDPARGRAHGSQIAGSGVHAACSAKWECADDAHAAILGKWWPIPHQDAVVTTTQCSACTFAQKCIGVSVTIGVCMYT